MHALIAVAMAIIINFCYGSFLDLAFTCCKTCKFKNDLSLQKMFSTPLLFAIVYSIIGVRLNAQTVQAYNKSGFGRLITLSIVDIALIPLSMSLSIVFYASNNNQEIFVSDIVNPVVFFLVMVCKHIILLAINDFIITPRRK